MSTISEQAKQLRLIAEEYRKPPYGREVIGTAEALCRAADTIEALSAKLAKENMERSERYYEIRKEIVEQHNKAYELINKMPLNGNEVWHSYVGGVMQTLGFLIGCMDNHKQK